MPIIWSSCCQRIAVPTDLPCASLSSTMVLAAMGREEISSAAVARVKSVMCFIAGIIVNLAVTQSSVHQWAMHDPQGGGVYCGKVLNLLRKKCNHGFERSGTDGGAGSGGRFSGAGRKDLPHDRDVQSGTAGAGGGRTRCAAGAAATGGARRAIGGAAARGGAVAQRAGGDSRSRGENAGAD